MSQMDALRMVEHVRTRLVDLAVSENHFRDSKLSDAAQRVWAGPGKEGGLVSELWVEGAFPGEASPHSLQTLQEDGLVPAGLCDQMRAQGVFPLDRPLYNHQAEAIRRSRACSGSRPAIVITAGTGLGKTEAFLIPMLADLWDAPARRPDGGMRCLILYPMNALVADQVARIYRWLRGQQRLTVFHFTSETPEDARKADSCGEPQWEPCRMRTRKEARGCEPRSGRGSDERGSAVPDIVITNYSMLEYMLCRPQDSPFFGPDLRCIILDEAHLYSGSLAAELTMLLRRVRERCGAAPEKILHLATSATLGGDDEALRAFAAGLFSTKEDQTLVIRGRQARHRFEGPEAPPETPTTASDLAPHAAVELTTLKSDEGLVEDDEKAVHALAGLVSSLVDRTTVEQARKDHPGAPARFLYATLRAAPLARRIGSALSDEHGNALALDGLARTLFDGKSEDQERNATIALLRLLAAARMQSTDLPLVPHRLHFLVRAPEGLSACLNPHCPGPQERRAPMIGCLQPYGDRCIYCQHILLPIYRCSNCGEWALAAHEDQQTSLLRPGYFAPSADKRTYYLLSGPRDQDLEEVVVDSEQGEVLGHGSEGAVLWEAPCDPQSSLQQCPTCHSTWGAQDQEPRGRRQDNVCTDLGGGRPLALSVVTETVLHDLPPYPEVSREWKPGKGRRLLCFSDSRASAARLGPLLTQQHEIQVIRAAITRAAGELAPDGEMSFLSDDVNRLKEEISGEPAHSQRRKHLEKELESKTERLKQMEAGRPFADFAACVAEQPGLAQLLDRDLAEKHAVASYGQNTWKENANSVKRHAEALVAMELQRPLRREASVESAGLLELVYPGIQDLHIPPGLEEVLPSSTRQRISEAWPSIVTLLLDTVRSDGCVGWSAQDTDRRRWLSESPLRGRWLTRTRTGWGGRAFVGATVRQLRRRFARNVLRAAGVSEADLDRLSEELLYAAFDDLYTKGFPWLQKEEHHQTGPEEADAAVQILIDWLAVRSPSSLFQCRATGTVWTKRALGWVPVEGCTGEVEPVDAGRLARDPKWGRVRREYRESGIFEMGLWAEEHSAQLHASENKRLQDLFRNGIRNVLSSTTTMELGVDIGGLNGVLLANVPPGPANHKQRAGRAGRRSEGSAVVVTYARGSDYDRQAFLRFGDFLKRELKKPTVLLDRENIIRRHLHAVLLSEYLRSRQPAKTGAMDAFGRMGAFCGVQEAPKWSRNGGPKPHWERNGPDESAGFSDFLNEISTSGSCFRDRLQHLSGGTGMEDIEGESGWRRFTEHAAESFSKAVEAWKEDIRQLGDAWEGIPKRPTRDLSQERAKASSIRYMANALRDITVIEWLADHGFLPRYGFPVNLQCLTVRRADDATRADRSKPDERYRLERSSLLALREYVPESRVLVGGRVATSRGLRKHWTDSNLDQALGLQYYALRCGEDHMYIRQSPKESCPTCEGPPVTQEQLVFPRFGYTTAGWEGLPRGTRLERVGEQSVCPVAFTEDGQGQVMEGFGGIANVRVTYREEAELLVRNTGRYRCGFAICTQCGFAMSEEKPGGKLRMGLPKGFETHPSVFDSDEKKSCWRKGEATAPLRNRVLAARQTTEMLLLEWPDATVSTLDATYSLGRALVLAGARLLELDERELGMVLMPLKHGRQGLVVYDTSAGGAGHSRELVRLGREWIAAARDKVLYVNEEHHSNCVKACLDCILDFSGQYDAHRLDRKAALNLMDSAMTT